MVAGVGKTVPLVYLQAQITFIFDLFLYRFLMFYLVHIVDPVAGLRLGAPLGDVVLGPGLTGP